MGFIVFIIMGALAGWIAGEIYKGDGFGLLGNIIVGIIGSFVGGFLMKTFGSKNYGGFVAELFVAVLGAIVFLFLLNLIS